MKATKALFDSIESIHIYSLAPHPMKDLQQITSTALEVRNIEALEDPLAAGSTYGTINNSQCRRRKVKRPPAPAAVVTTGARPKSTVLPTSIKDEAKAAKSEVKESKQQATTSKDFFAKNKSSGGSVVATLRKETSSVDAGGAGDASSKESTPAPAAPPALKKEKSSLFKAFAKAKPKAPDARKTPKVEDLAGMSDDEDVGEDKDLFDKEKPQDEALLESGRQKRKEREDALRKMMDESDDDEVPAAAQAEPTQEEDSDAMDVETENEKPAVSTQEDTTDITPVSGAPTGRRRGRKRVLKKRTVTDDDGYLGT